MAQTWYVASVTHKVAPSGSGLSDVYQTTVYFSDDTNMVMDGPRNYTVPTSLITGTDSATKSHQLIDAINSVNGWSSTNDSVPFQLGGLLY